MPRHVPIIVFLIKKLYQNLTQLAIAYLDTNLYFSFHCIQSKHSHKNRPYPMMEFSIVDLH